METSWHTYPKIYALGHAALADLFNGEVVIQEKIDGSQFSFGVFDGEIKCRSKGKEQDPDAPDKMFSRALDTVHQLAPTLTPGWTYRAEYLQKPKHNALCYDRTPDGHLIVFDINDGHESYLSPESVRGEAERIGIEAVPTIATCCSTPTMEMLDGFLQRESVLGGVTIEGVVIKNYSQFGADKKVLMGKYVSEAFKEKHEKVWGEQNKSHGDIVKMIVERYRTEARWDKAVQHLRDNGLLERSPRDIGTLITEIPADILDECEGEIKDILFKHFWKQISRGVTMGMPEWYKRRLAESALEPTASNH